MRSELPIRVPALEPAGASVETILERNPHILEPTEFSCDDDDIDELEEVIGRSLPDELVSLLKLSDGGALVGPRTQVRLASSDQLAHWAEEGALDELESLPFGLDETGAVLVIDTDGEWGGPRGAVYKVSSGRPTFGRLAVRNAVRLADSLADLLAHVAEGKNPW